MEDNRTPEERASDRRMGWVLVIIAGIVMILGALGASDKKPDTHCATAAQARYKNVPGGAPSWVSDDFVRRCEAGYR